MEVKVKVTHIIIIFCKVPYTKLEGVECMNMSIVLLDSSCTFLSRKVLAEPKPYKYWPIINRNLYLSLFVHVNMIDRIDSNDPDGRKSPSSKFVGMYVAT